MKQEKDSIINKIEKPLGLLKGYIIPALIFICGVAVAWFSLSFNVQTNTQAIEKLENRVTVIEDYMMDTNGRLIRIETQLEEIYKIIEREYGK